VDEFPV